MSPRDAGAGRAVGRPPTVRAGSAHPRTRLRTQRPTPVRGEDGVLSLEAVLLLPVLALLLVALFQAAVVVRDVLLLHEAARVGARAAATEPDVNAVVAAARAAVPELDVQVTLDPSHRQAGQRVTVTVRATRQIGPVRHQLRADAVAVVEPILGAADLAADP